MLYLYFIKQTNMTQVTNQGFNRIKLEQYMDAENKKGWQVEHHRRGTKAYKLAKAAVSYPGAKVRTTVNQGQYQRCHFLNTVSILKGAGIDFTSGNDAPKGGKHGNYVVVNE